MILVFAAILTEYISQTTHSFVAGSWGIMSLRHQRAEPETGKTAETQGESLKPCDPSDSEPSNLCLHSAQIVGLANCSTSRCWGLSQAKKCNFGNL